MVANASGHCGCHAQGLVYASEIVVHEVDCQRVNVVLKFLGKPIGQSGESAHVHPHRKILALDVAGRDIPPVRISGNVGGECSNAASGTIVGFRFRVIAVQLDQHRVINFTAEGILNRVQINPMTVCCKLYAIRKSRCQISDEVIGVASGTASHKPARNQFGIGAERRPRPNISKAKPSPQVFGNVLFFGVAKRPNLIALNPFARQIAERLVLILGASAAQIGDEFDHGIFCNARHADGRANRIALDQSREHLNLAVYRECVHG